MKHSISEAAKLTGKARSTLHRHLKQGRLSKETGPDGQPVIDASELMRVYGPLQRRDSGDTVSMRQGEAPRDIPLLQPVQSKIEALLEEQIARLTADLSDARQERDDWKAQANEWRQEAQKISGLLTAQKTDAVQSAVADKPNAGGVISRLWKRMF